MPTAPQQRDMLVRLLTELFQLNQPDLDFGFWRIMHAKSRQVTEFLETDLLGIMAETFRETGEAKGQELKGAYEEEVHKAREYGAAEPDKAPKVMEAYGRWQAATDTSNAESDVTRARPAAVHRGFGDLERLWHRGRFHAALQAVPEGRRTARERTPAHDPDAAERYLRLRQGPEDPAAEAPGRGRP
jgi:hypothetical protein